MKLFTAIAIVAMSVSTSTEAVSINSSVYFAYAEGPGGVITVSRQPCSLKKFASAGWKKARFYRSESDPGIDSCWIKSEKPFKNAVSICLLSDEKPGEFEACAPTVKDAFLETKSLPKSSNF